MSKSLCIKIARKYILCPGQRKREVRKMYLERGVWEF